jgi:hypothetical protein
MAGGSGTSSQVACFFRTRFLQSSGWRPPTCQIGTRAGYRYPPDPQIRDVLRLSAAGLSKRQIAASLGIGPPFARSCFRIIPLEAKSARRRDRRFPLRLLPQLRQRVPMDRVVPLDLDERKIIARRVRPKACLISFSVAARSNSSRPRLSAIFSTIIRNHHRRGRSS